MLATPALFVNVSVEIIPCYINAISYFFILRLVLFRVALVECSQSDMKNVTVIICSTLLMSVDYIELTGPTLVLNKNPTQKEG